MRVTLRQKSYRHRLVWRLAIALILAVSLWLINPSYAAALGVDDYFTYSYNVEFSKAEVSDGETFTATVTGQATCHQDLPLPVNQARITSHIVATHQTSGATVELNSGYTMTISPFPSQAGQTSQVSTTVSLQFPEGSESGTYSVSADLVEAQVNVVVLGWMEVTSYLPPSEAIGSIACVATAVVPGGAAVPSAPTAPPAADLPPGTSDVSGFVAADGTFTDTVVAKSFDGKCWSTIGKGTKGLTQEGAPLTEIAMTEMESPPDPPEQANVIGIVYEFGPTGATFYPSMTLTFTYDDLLLPTGAAEKNLVVAMAKAASELKWIVLEGCVVDPANNTITVPVTHFTPFTVLAYTRPAAFAASNLTITPIEIGVGQEVTISALITNGGDLAGSHEVALRIDDVVIGNKGVTLAGGGSQKVTFTTIQYVPRTYIITVDGQSGKLVVKPEPVPVSPPPPTTAPSPPTPSPAPPVVPPAPPAPPVKPINWWLLGSIIGACATFIVIILLVAMRREA